MYRNWESNKKQLWLQLKEYNFEHIVPPSLMDRVTSLFGGPEAPTRAFADKIARKHKWNGKFALAALSEYKKFVYLAVISKFQVTPSKVIDTVWHEHILFSKAYREFCNDVIQHQFNHHPELIPFEEQTNQYRSQFEKTIDLYKFEFGEKPPSEIWDDTKYKKAKGKKRKSESDVSGWDSSSYSDSCGEGGTPLYEYFEGGGGFFGGGGASGKWSDGCVISDSSGSSGESGGDGGGCSGGCGGD